MEGCAYTAGEAYIVKAIGVPQKTLKCCKSNRKDLLLKLNYIEKREQVSKSRTKQTWPAQIGRKKAGRVPPVYLGLRIGRPVRRIRWPGRR
ncbi:hypothetical protein MA16_Dca017513 [Dendrobium catenatum]|uniref:Uncharacterized protein n=1 Tax=Dendrobium catenatum TaxID=906689 RepID=A0A2I0X3U6_9ASPA|nr:hypothetical protein MA16_Dca017513 [Dendrobium catenatum]